jgi:hypothetical protein
MRTTLLKIWRYFAGEDTKIFSRMFLTMPGVGEVDFFDLFYGTEIRRCHTDNFLAGFDPLAELHKTAIQTILFWIH